MAIQPEKQRRQKGLGRRGRGLVRIRQMASENRTSVGNAELMDVHH
jgi:hypothetical protein